MASADALLERLSGCPVLVVGDLMLDHFVIGRVDRISPEAPVPVVRFEQDEFRIGGAANVASTIAALGGRVSLVGIVGPDPEADRLRAALGDVAMDSSGVITDPGRPTTRKVRVVTTRNQQVARIDYESDLEVSGPVEAALITHLRHLAAGVRVVVLSDYLKGVVSRAVATAAIEAAAARDIPLLVDPKVPHIDYYRGATLITPNHHEAESVTHMRIRTDDEARDAARRFRERAGCRHLLITRGEQGMWLLEDERETVLAAEAREVADVTGAGDTVIGTIALALAAGGSLVEAARLANRAAGVVVGKFGPATVTPAELRSGS